MCLNRLAFSEHFHILSGPCADQAGLTCLVFSKNMRLSSSAEVLRAPRLCEEFGSKMTHFLNMRRLKSIFCDHPYQILNIWWKRCGASCTSGGCKRLCKEYNWMGTIFVSIVLSNAQFVCNCFFSSETNSVAGARGNSFKQHRFRVNAGWLILKRALQHYSIAFKAQDILGSFQPRRGTKGQELCSSAVWFNGLSAVGRLCITSPFFNQSYSGYHCHCCQTI